MDEHLLPLQELVDRLGTKIDSGLSQPEAQARLLTYGKNIVATKKETPLVFKWLWHMVTGFALLLWVAAGKLLFSCLNDYQIVNPCPTCRTVLGGVFDGSDSNGQYYCHVYLVTW
jgi:hypothetical protein